MKRSEMENKISDIIEYAFYDTNESYCQTVAQSILDMIEHNGMLPPKRFKPNTEITHFEWCLTPDVDIYKEDGVYGFDVNEWELEDEA